MIIFAMGYFASGFTADAAELRQLVDLAPQYMRVDAPDGTVLYGNHPCSGFWLSIDRRPISWPVSFYPSLKIFETKLHHYSEHANVATLVLQASNIL